MLTGHYLISRVKGIRFYAKNIQPGKRGAQRMLDVLVKKKINRLEKVSVEFIPALTRNVNQGRRLISIIRRACKKQSRFCPRNSLELKRKTKSRTDALYNTEYSKEVYSVFVLNFLRSHSDK